MVVNCEHVWREMSNYVDGDIDAGLCAAMEEHFHTCQRCRSVMQGMRNVVLLYRDDRMIDVPSGFGRRLERKLTEVARVRSRSWSPWSAWLVPVAALLLIAGGVRIASSRTVAHPLLSEHAQPAHGVPADMIVVVSSDAKEFHVAGCEFIHNKDKERTLTAGEAMKEGYVPCVRCMRKYLQTAGVAHIAMEPEAYLYAESEQ
jgi:hypothetical protein